MESDCSVNFPRCGGRRKSLFSLFNERTWKNMHHEHAISAHAYCEHRSKHPTYVVWSCDSENACFSGCCITCIAIAKDGFFIYFFARTKTWKLGSHKNPTLHLRNSHSSPHFSFPTCMSVPSLLAESPATYLPYSEQSMSLPRRDPQVDVMSHFQFGIWTVHVFGRFRLSDFRHECGLFDASQSKCPVSGGLS